MDDDTVQETVEEQVETEASTEPLEVKVVNQIKQIYSIYDSQEDLEYENLYPTEEQIKEFEDNANST